MGTTYYERKIYSLLVSCLISSYFFLVTLLNVSNIRWIKCLGQLMLKVKNEYSFLEYSLLNAIIWYKGIIIAVFLNGII